MAYDYTKLPACLARPRVNIISIINCKLSRELTSLYIESDVAQTPNKTGVPGTISTRLTGGSTQDKYLGMISQAT